MSGVRHNRRLPVAARLVGRGAALLLALVGAVALAEEAGPSPADGVLAAPARGGVYPLELMEQVRAAARRGGRLYDERRYLEALPHLVAAARYGLKVPQASAGDIYLHGRGGVPRNLQAGIGWLGVAAAPPTSKRIADYFKQVLDQLPDDFAVSIDQIVAGYRAKYGHRAHRVDCRLRGEIVEDLECRFIDHPDTDPAVADGTVEEVIVTAPIIRAQPPEFGEMPSGEFISQVYFAASRGSRLYNEGRYKEALPLLVIAAKRGFKWSQASAADIYLHGRGGVPADLEAGIGWLGVAARPKTTGRISRFFKESVAKLPAHYTPEIVDQIVAGYHDRYGNQRHRVACRFAANEGASLSLRLKRLRCHFIDEATQCRGIAMDGEEIYSQWTCAPQRGTRALDVRPY